MGANLYWPEGSLGISRSWAYWAVWAGVSKYFFFGKMRVEKFSTLGFGEVVDREKGRDEGDLT